MKRAPLVRIRILPKELIDRIAAGEVVERPASVLKELVENALDAEATAVTVTVEADPIDGIEVLDNGIGMTREELSLALQRHATSKLTNEQDLFMIRTLGFRGEALPSIAAVSDLVVETRARHAPLGVRVTYEAGVETDCRECGMAAGTRVLVKNLFRYTPARRKFLRSRQTETGHVLDLFVRLALSRPDVSFQLRKKAGAMWLNAPATEALRERVAQVLGWETAEALCPIEAEQGDWRIEGLAAPPGIHRATAAGIHLFVNCRPIRDQAMVRALRDAYPSALSKDRYPVAFLYLSVPYGQVDVNVHPTKQEVRFSDPLRARKLVLKAFEDLGRRAPWQGTRPGVLRSGLAESSSSSPLEHGPSPEPQRAAASPAAEDVPHSAQRPTPGQPYRPPRPDPSRPAAVVRETGPAADQTASASQEPLWEPTARTGPPLRLIGQFRGTYLVCESSEGLVLIDQHAAHERLAFEKLEQTLHGSVPERQPLVTPALVELPPQQAVVFQAYLDVLAAFGFEIDLYGGATFAVKAVPALVAQADPVSLCRDLAEEILTAERTNKLEDLRRRVLSRMACHAVVRAGQALEPDEMEALLAALKDNPDVTTCPHGRPVRILLTLREIEKRFQRT